MALSNVTIGTSNTAVFSASVETMILGLIFCNTSSGSVTLNVYLVPSGTSISTSNQVLRDIVIAAGDTFVWTMDERLVLSPGNSIRATASVANALTATVVHRNV